MKQAYFLGIDNGGTMSKAAIFDVCGKELSVASSRVRQLTQHVGWNVSGLIRLLINLIQRLVSERICTFVAV
jgi:sugar (pentulose or hexulose) kinase